MSSEINKIELTSKDLEQAGIIPKDTPPAQIKIFGRLCQNVDLDPLKKQIYLINSRGTYINMVSIDGLRTIASRAGHVATSDVIFDGDKNMYEIIKEGRNHPLTATITVTKYVNGLTFETTATVDWFSYQKQNNTRTSMWDKMPFMMLSKCAEAVALRKAFPEAQKLYVAEEICE